MEPNQELDPRIAKKLSSLAGASPRSQRRVVRERSAFLQHAHDITSRLPLTDSRKMRLYKWMHPFQSLSLLQKEYQPMFGTIMALILALSLVFGGGGITYAAAQNSLPDQPLYGLKIWAEDTRQNFTADPLTGYELALQFTARRAEEVQRMAQAGQVPPQALENRYRLQVEAALRLAINQPDAAVPPALEQVREQLRQQEQLMAQLHEGASEAAQGILLRIRQMLQERIRDCDDGIADPIQLRERLRQSQPQTPPGPNGTRTPTPGEGVGPGPNATVTPQRLQERTGQPTDAGPHGTQQGPNSSATPQGPGLQQTPEPQGTPQGSGPQPTPNPQGTQQGPGPQPTSIPQGTQQGNQNTPQPGGGGGK